MAAVHTTPAIIGRRLPGDPPARTVIFAPTVKSSPSFVDPSSDSTGLDLELIRRKIVVYTDTGRAQSALYWADKLLTLEPAQFARNAILYIQLLVRLQCYDRAYSFLRKRELERAHPTLQYLSVLCLFHTCRFDEALVLAELEAVPSNDLTNADVNYLNQVADEWSVHSAIQLLLARLYERCDNNDEVLQCYRNALRLDAHCHEALSELGTRHLLDVVQEHELLEELPLDDCDEHHANTVRALYSLDLSLETRSALQHCQEPSVSALENNPDVLCARAATNFHCGNLEQAFALCQRVLDKEDYHGGALVTQICTLAELRRSNDLFLLAHRLVDSNSDSWIAWFAVGLYYYTIELFESSKRLLRKATGLAPRHGALWLAYGHAFAASSEHDRAINCYLRAEKLMKGSHLPQLYIGLEYSLTGNTKLAKDFYDEAFKRGSLDPYLLHEMGVLAYQSRDLPVARDLFVKVLDIVSRQCKFQTSDATLLPPRWQSLLVNLGHCHRRLNELDKALEHYHDALALSGRKAKADVIAAVALVKMLQDSPAEAIQHLHRSLSLHRNAKVPSSLLERAVTSAANDPAHYSDDTENVVKLKLNVGPPAPRFASPTLPSCTAALQTTQNHDAAVLQQSEGMNESAMSIEDIEMDIS